MNYIRREIAKNLKEPKKSLMGYIAKKRMMKRNEFLEESAVKLCQIEPHHNVLEVGFGPGLGLAAAYQHIKDDNGQVCGLDRSMYMVRDAQNRFRPQIRSGHMDITWGDIYRMPFCTDQFDRVFHCNAYYFWKRLPAACAELYRVMKPDSLMVTTLNIARLKEVKRDLELVKAQTDPLAYMYCLEAAGFVDVNIQYLEDKGKSFEVIYARIYDKQRNEYYEGS